ncbi:MAG: hypothetical protein HZC41_27035 [Chloroflexi bacterium]|nr:hypothetical protein [Chloroflexota bacterium]
MEQRRVNSENITRPYSSRLSQKPERGGCLMTWLVLSAVMTIFALFTFITLLNTVVEKPYVLRGGSPVVLLVLGVLILANLLFLADIANWKRRGAYGLVVISIASPIVEGILKTATLADFIAPVIQLGILYFLIKGIWDYFD